MYGCTVARYCIRYSQGDEIDNVEQYGIAQDKRGRKARAGKQVGGSLNQRRRKLNGLKADGTLLRLSVLGTSGSALPTAFSFRLLSFKFSSCHEIESGNYSSRRSPQPRSLHRSRRSPQPRNLYMTGKRWLNRPSVATSPQTES